jgi:hypothetical protein
MELLCEYTSLFFSSCWPGRRATDFTDIVRAGLALPPYKGYVHGETDWKLAATPMEPMILLKIKQLSEESQGFRWHDQEVKLLKIDLLDSSMEGYENDQKEIEK